MLEDERASLRLPPSPDPERVAAFLRRCVDQMPRHLRRLIRREDRMDVGRFEELVREVQESALAGTAGSAASRGAAPFQQATRLTAGLYRHEDAVDGVLEYRLFPRQPLRYQGEAIRVRFGGEDRQLQPFAERWFRWLGAVPLYAPEPVEVVGHPRFTQLILPASTFWVFVRQSGETGPWATWRRPELGDRFLLLCRPCHEPHLGVLREGKLIAWDQVCERAVRGERWLEYVGCRVEASNWNEVNESEESADLFAALRPSSRAAIHLSGGLPAPDGIGWMAGSPPGAWVCAFQDQVELCLSSLAGAACEVSWKIDANAPGRPQDLPEGLPAGPYLLTARVGGRLLTERVMELRNWVDLEAAAPERRECAIVSGHRLCGATLQLPDR